MKKVTVDTVGLSLKERVAADRRERRENAVHFTLSTMVINDQTSLKWEHESDDWMHYLVNERGQLVATIHKASFNTNGQATNDRSGRSRRADGPRYTGSLIVNGQDVEIAPEFTLHGMKESLIEKAEELFCQ